MSQKETLCTDDSTILSICNTLDEAWISTTSVLENCAKWLMDENLILLKTQSIVFSYNNGTESMKLLCIHIDYNWQWDDQIIC